ncbi:hypothetical protein [Nocardia sp. NBC_00511]|uniref:hypothetical protein n=1 Tax=Nocardia sp. NBC_00511 TaxID=2903591 RepID=UPI0030E2A2DC
MSAHEEFDVSVDGYFAILPEWVIDAEISDRAVRLYAVLRRFANGELKARPSRAKLAVRLRTSLSSLDRALRELQVIGAITVRHRWTNPAGSSFTHDRDEAHQVRAANGYVLHNAPVRVRGKQGGVVTGDTTPLVTGDDTLSPLVTTPLSSPVTVGVASPVTRGVVSPVTHELEPVEPEKKDKKTSSSAKPPRTPEPKRADVEALCERLVARMIENDCKPPKITDTWRREARLMLDADGRDFDKAMRLLDWCQSDEFWSSVIHSMPTFRKKYDTVRQQANRSVAARPQATGLTVARGDQKVLDTFQRGEDLKRRLAANQLAAPGRKEIAG